MTISNAQAWTKCSSMKHAWGMQQTRFAGKESQSGNELWPVNATLQNKNLHERILQKMWHEN